MTDAPVDNHPCDQCGQLDNHPVVHVFAETYHFDCLPMKYRSQIADDPSHANTRETIAAAESGIHGDELRELIVAQSPDVEPETQEA